jgi:4-amino-4-deoxy-L-arabinose transferase-like glycosyltransferase
MSFVKRYKFDRYDIFAIAIILFAAALRLLLVALGWPPTNSDEGTMGVMALDIAYHGAHPVMYYGQNYMSAIEAYLGAALFHVFGPSLWVLRLGVILMVSLFLLNMYLLTNLLYSKSFALFVLALLSLGSNFIFTLEIYAKGGTSQTLLFGSLAFLCASWLALSCAQDLFGKQRHMRLAGYAVWGTAVGLGIWSDMIVLPILFVAGLLLFCFCWQDLRRPWSILCLLLGLFVGLFPLITFNLVVQPQQNSFSTFIGLFHGGQVQQAHTLAQILQGIINTIQISLPLATGDPSCPISAIHYGGGTIPQSPSCMVLHTIWGLSYVVLWLLAVILVVKALRRLRAQPSQKLAATRNFARLFLLAGAGIAASVFAISSAPLGMPQGHARYLMTLLIVTPAILWPLWNRLSDGVGADVSRPGVGWGQRIVAHEAYFPHPTPGRDTSAPTPKSEAYESGKGKHIDARALASVAPTFLLCIVCAAFLLGTIFTFADVPSAQAADQQQETLIHYLLLTHTTRIYTEYWTCDRIAFMSQERVICGVLDNNLHPSHNRDTAFYTIVSSDPHAAYVFPVNSPQRRILDRKIAKAGTLHDYSRFTVAGYVIYKPQSKP